jgi:hypothetical protein
MSGLFFSEQEKSGAGEVIFLFLGELCCSRQLTDVATGDAIITGRVCRTGFWFTRKTLAISSRAVFAAALLREGG